jgi:hypothetical protein
MQNLFLLRARSLSHSLSRNRMFVTSSMPMTVAEAAESAQATGPTTYNAGSHPYEPIPSTHSLHKVVVVHRHGDRSQITRNLGLTYPESDSIKDLWESKMPSSETLRKMAAAFQSSLHVTLKAEGNTADSADSYADEEHLYSGEDKDARPYAQLTELGSQQLINIGKNLRSRYTYAAGNKNKNDKKKNNKIISSDYEDACDDIYIRSTNMCRTLQSLRSLIVGLYDISKNKKSSLITAASSSSSSSSYSLSVHTRSKDNETMFPKANSILLAAKRSLILPDSLYHETHDGYTEYEKRIKLALGYDPNDINTKVSWLTVKEILSCYKVHGHPYPLDLNYEDEEFATIISGWMWGVLFKDEDINRLACGRFIKELLNDIKNEQKDKNMLIYSGHDSTLVPLLCALGVYNDQWPPYASYLVLEFIVDNTTGEEYVRALYNDQIVNMFNTDTDTSTSNDMVSMNFFIEQLNKFVISEQEYLESLQPIHGNESKEVQDAIKTMVAEANATINTNSKSNDNSKKSSGSTL